MPNRNISPSKQEILLVYDPASDPDFVKFKAKLARKKENGRVLAANIQATVEKHNRQRL